MKKTLSIATFMLFSAVAFSQSSSLADTITASQVKVINKENKVSSADSSRINVLSAEQIKTILEAKDKNGEYKINGTNVIIGNNNTIIVVDDKKTAESYIHSVQNAKENKLSQPKFRFTRNFLERYAIGIKASTMGIGAEFATSLVSNLTLRVGYNYSNYTTNSFEVNTSSDELREATVSKDFYPTYKAEATFKQNHAHALVDIYPMRNGIFHLTGGVYLGHTKISVDGQFIDQTGNPIEMDPAVGGWPLFGFNDRFLNIDENGRMEAELEMGNYIKPYVGIGLGRSIPKNRFGVKFEIGAVYNGDYKLMQNGKELAVYDQVEDGFKNAEDFTKYLKWFPVMNIQLIYRLK